MSLHRFIYRYFEHSDYIGTQYETVAFTSQWKKIRDTLEEIKGLLEALGNYELTVASKHWKDKQDRDFF